MVNTGVTIVIIASILILLIILVGILLPVYLRSRKQDERRKRRRRKRPRGRDRPPSGLIEVQRERLSDVDLERGGPGVEVLEREKRPYVERVYGPAHRPPQPFSTSTIHIPVRPRPIRLESASSTSRTPSPAAGPAPPPVRPVATTSQTADPTPAPAVPNIVTVDFRSQEQEAPGGAVVRPNPIIRDATAGGNQERERPRDVSTTAQDHAADGETRLVETPKPLAESPPAPEVAAPEQYAPDPTPNGGDEAGPAPDTPLNLPPRKATSQNARDNGANLAAEVARDNAEFAEGQRRDREARTRDESQQDSHVPGGWESRD